MAISTGAVTSTTRAAGSRIFGNHRRSPSNVSNSSSVNTSSSNINPSFRLEDEIDSQFSSPNSMGQRVAFDLDPPRASQTSASIRPNRQNSELERPGTLVCSPTPVTGSFFPPRKCCWLAYSTWNSLRIPGASSKNRRGYSWNLSQIYCTYLHLI